MLYDLAMCPHRVTMDLYGDPAMRDEPNPFVKMLWARGSLCEREVIARLQVPFLDLSTYSGDEKERLTLEAMLRGEPLIYSGRIEKGASQADLKGAGNFSARIARNPGRLSSSSNCPRCSFAHAATIASPSPLPGECRAGSSLTKRCGTMPRLSAGIPGPVSATTMRT